MPCLWIVVAALLAYSSWPRAARATALVLDPGTAVAGPAHRGQPTARRPLQRSKDELQQAPPQFDFGKDIGPGDVEPFLRVAIARHRTTDGDAHKGTGARLTALGECLTRLGRYADAEAPLLEAHRVLHQAVGDQHDWTTQARKALVALYDAWQKPAQADEWRARLSAQDP